MYEENFGARLTELRQRKGVSARDMSLSIGQNAGYINNIENGKSLPSMKGFFYICDYLEVTPMQFFDPEDRDPKTLSDFIGDCKKLDEASLRILTELIRKLLSKT